MHRIIVGIATAVLSLPITPPVRGQQLLKPQSIRFDGSDQYSTDELLTVVGVKKGEVYTADYLNQSAQKLMATGVFEKVGFKFDGVDLVYQIRESADLYPVLIDNLPLNTGAELDAHLHERIPLYHGKVPSEGGMLDDVRDTLQSMLAAEGIEAKVTTVPAGDHPNKKATAMKFRIDAPPVEVGDIQVSGVSDSMLPKITEAAKRVNRSFDTAHSAKNIDDQIASGYLFNGFPKASVETRLVGMPVVGNGVVRVPFAVSVQEGRVYKLGTVHLAAGLLFAMSDLEKMVMTRDRYVPESYYVGAMMAALSSRLKGKGYLDCKVTPKPEIDEGAGVVNYTIDAVTGPQYHLGLLKFDNVGDTLRSLLMKNWQMMPGDPFDESYVANFILFAQKSDPALQRSLAGVKATYDVHADSETHEVNLVIRLQRQ